MGNFFEDGDDETKPSVKETVDVSMSHLSTS